MGIYGLTCIATMLLVAYRLSAKYNRTRLRAMLNWLCLVVVIHHLLIGVGTLGYMFTDSAALFIILITHFYTNLLAICTVMPLAIIVNAVWYTRHRKGINRKRRIMTGHPHLATGRQA